MQLCSAVPRAAARVRTRSFARCRENKSGASHYDFSHSARTDARCPAAATAERWAIARDLHHTTACGFETRQVPTRVHLVVMSRVGRKRGLQKAWCVGRSPASTWRPNSNSPDDMMSSLRRRHPCRCFGVMLTAAAPSPASSLQQPLHSRTTTSACARGSQAVIGTRTPACRSSRVHSLRGARLLDSEGRATSSGKKTSRWGVYTCYIMYIPAAVLVWRASLAGSRTVNLCVWPNQYLFAPPTNTAAV